MTAQPVHEPDPDDPIEILRLLPEAFHEQFLVEYRMAVDGARRPEEYRALHDLLRLWRLRAVAYSDPGYAERLAAVRGSHVEGFVSADQVIPDWPSR
ncbi:MAG: DUF6247 family protein [Streptosporangiaceae bacterium]